MTKGQSFTGIERKRRTTWRVKAGDRVARFLITFGGFGTIVAVVGVFAFLLAVVLPLLRDAKIEESKRTPFDDAATVLRMVVDESRTLAWTLSADGTARTIDLRGGKVLERAPIVAGTAPTAASFSIAGTSFALGRDDGTIVFGSVVFSSVRLAPADVPAEARKADAERGFVDKNTVVRTLPDGEFARYGAAVVLTAPQTVKAGAKIVAVDHAERSNGYSFAAVTAAGELHVGSIEQRKNLITRKVTSTLTEGSMKLESVASRGLPDRILLSGLGDAVICVWKDGTAERIDAGDVKAPSLAETVDLAVDKHAAITAIEWMNGRNTLIVGDAAGRLTGWFRIKPKDSGTADGMRLVRTHVLEGSSARVTSIAPSTRSRLIAVGYADGSTRVYQVTSDDLIAVSGGPGDAAVALAMAPKEDAIVVLRNNEIATLDFDPLHPDATFHSLFRKVWYEGAEKPEHVWQSSGGSDDVEAKLGLVPLIFGTMKATFYSLVFGVPLALLAAVFTSEFMHPRLRAKVKPTVELMASLPSVVLGFVAGILVAPLIENLVPQVIAGFVTVPLALLIAAYLWQMAPYRVILAFDRWRLLLVLLVIPLGVVAAGPVGRFLEWSCFAGDIKAWLNGDRGSGAGGWAFLSFPAAAILVFVVISRTLYPALRSRLLEKTRHEAGLVELGLFLGGFLLTCIVAAAIGGGLAAIGFDPRGSLVDTYESRNALIVGIVMGFAIIPIVYTIAEDALSTVPEHLRAASLGAGATRWQTAVRIVIPTAASGLFSAVMVGLGRAVGETMIVLMAAGNTPVMSWNIFNGFRTLSANIAYELPEAVRDSTHYRTLFAAALALLVMTFILNTAAEVVRLRFRKRAVQL